VHNTCSIANITAGSLQGTYKGPLQLLSAAIPTSLYLDFIKIYSKSSGSTTTYNCTLYALDDLHLEHTFNTLPSINHKIVQAPIHPNIQWVKGHQDKHNAPEALTDAAMHCQLLH
jgi:hypothetical protein